MSLEPESITLSDGSKATLFPVYGSTKLSDDLESALRDLLNYEIEAGQTYPFDHQLSETEFFDYWRKYFCAVLVEGDVSDITVPGLGEKMLGSFVVKPNYVGRCSHVCNGGFLVSPKSRGKRVGSTMGKIYIDWAGELGYEYSVFNLVFQTNEASWRIWDKLGFDRIGLIPGAGKLKGIEGNVDAIMFGKKLSKRSA